MTSEMLKIRWDNHPSALQNMFLKSLKKGDKLVDVTLASGDGTTIKCHRLVLVAHSNYFDRVFSAHPDANGLIIHLTNLNSWQLEALVTFMYSGELCVSADQLPDFFKAAKDVELNNMRLPDRDQNDMNANEGQVGLSQQDRDQPLQKVMMKEPPKMLKIQREVRLSDNAIMTVGKMVNATGMDLEGQDRQN